MKEKLLFIFISLSLLILTAASGLLLINTYLGDPTIYLVYARNIASGDFFSFNRGEFSSGSTSPLWALFLSLAFIVNFENGPLFSKILSFLSTSVAIFISFLIFRTMSKSKIGSTTGAFIIAYFLILPGNMIFESSLIVLLILCSMYLFHIIHSTKEIHSKFQYYLLLIILSLIPLSRPDAFIVLVILLSGVVYKQSVTEKGNKYLLIAFSVFVSLIPTAVYFGYSYFKLDSFSVSSYCRAFALKENANSILGFKYSIIPLKYFFLSPKIIFLIMTIWGVKVMVASRGFKVLGYITLLSLLCYFVLLTSVSPITEDVGRYFLPVIPFMGLATAVFINYLNEKANGLNFLLFLLPTFVVFYSYYSLIPTILNQRSCGLDFNTIVEKNIINSINKIAEKNSMVLMYEVQDRFYLREDIKVLSLDGIVDGKIAPYLSSGDLYSFLMKYKPNYWLANDAIYYRPFLRASILYKVLEIAIKNGKKNVAVGSLTFEKVLENNEKRILGFASSRVLFKVSYAR